MATPESLLAFYGVSAQILPTFLIAAFVGTNAFPPPNRVPTPQGQGRIPAEPRADTAPLRPFITLPLMGVAVLGESAALYGVADSKTAPVLTFLTALGLVSTFVAVLIPVAAAQLRAADPTGRRSGQVRVAQAVMQLTTQRGDRLLLLGTLISGTLSYLSFAVVDRPGSTTTGGDIFSDIRTLGFALLLIVLFIVVDQRARRRRKHT